MNNEKDILYKLKWFNNPDNHKGTDQSQGNRYCCVDSSQGSSGSDCRNS